MPHDLLSPSPPMSIRPGRVAGWAAILLFVAGGIGLGCAFLGSFGQFGLLTRTERAMVVFDRPIGGLRAGAMVTFRGVRLGRVEHVGLTADPQHGRALIPVTIRIQPERIHMTGGEGALSPHLMLLRLIQDGLQAELHSASLVTGRVGIDLDIVPGPVPLPHSGLSSLPEIPAHESRLAILRRTLTTLPIHKMAAEWQQTARNGQEIAAHIQTALPATRASLADLAASTHTAATTMAAARQRIAKDSRQTQGALSQLVTTAHRQKQDRSAEIGMVTRDTKAALSAARQIRSDLHTPDDTLKTDLTATGRDLAAGGAALRDAAGDIRRRPTVLLTGPGR
ncbi:MlaD family protein [Gluconacetobacter sp. Hr-1-5]|uniref:MlaD family protein n=1 Tax=Gluconacetobacter sp. Hr-1-5 TaxID=3395370 RepID=UPI003B51E788